MIIYQNNWRRMIGFKLVQEKVSLFNMKIGKSAKIMAVSWQKIQIKYL
jgi:hypothetical protein